MVYASWDYNSGVYIGNINNVNGAKVKINHEGDITSEAAACRNRCFTELLGEKIVFQLEILNEFAL